jgi:hypothetical protein
MILVYTWPAIIGLIILGMWLGGENDYNDSGYF